MPGSCLLRAEHFGNLDAQAVFHHDEATATEIMLHIHRRGIGVAGVYSREIAETRVAEVEQLARAHEFPLRCSVEEA